MENHLEERLLDQAQARVYTPLFWGHSRSIPQASLFLVAWIPSPGGGGLPAFLEILGALSGITPPPPPGGGRPRVGWDFLGEIFVSKIFILPLSNWLPDLVSTLAVLCYVCGLEVLGSNPERWGI